MKMNVNNIFMVGILVVANNVCGMERIELQKSKEKEEFRKKIAEEMNIMLNEHSKNKDSEDTRLLAANVFATDMRRAVLADDLCAQVVNEPQFCLQLIKKVAQTFKLSHIPAAQMLRIEGAHRRLELQDRFEFFLNQTLVDRSSIELVKSVQRLKLVTFEHNLQDFIQKGVDLDWEDEGNRLPAVSMASRLLDIDIVNILIKNGANVNIVCSNGRVLLYYMINHSIYNRNQDIQNRYIEMIKIFLQAGAELDKLPEECKNAKSLKEAQRQLAEEEAQQK